MTHLLSFSLRRSGTDVSTGVDVPGPFRDLETRRAPDRSSGNSGKAGKAGKAESADVDAREFEFCQRAAGYIGEELGRIGRLDTESTSSTGCKTRGSFYDWLGSDALANRASRAGR